MFNRVSFTLDRAQCTSRTRTDDYHVYVDDDSLSGYFQTDGLSVGGLHTGDRVLVAPSIKPKGGDVVMAAVGPAYAPQIVMRV